MPAYTKRTLWCEVNLDDFENPFKVAGSGGPIDLPVGTGLRLKIAFFEGTSLADVSRFTSAILRVLAQSRTGAAFIDSGAIADFNITLTLDQWNAGTAAHLTIDIPGGANTELPLDDGEIKTRYYAILFGYTEDDAVNHADFGWANLDAYRDGISDVGPILAGNAVPTESVYDGAGHFTLNLTQSRTYLWTKGANDTSVTNGTETVNETGADFTAQGATVTLNGTAGEAVTAVVRNAGAFTPDQADARYQQKVPANANFRFKAGQMHFWDDVAAAADATKPWRALGVHNGATVWSDPILD